MGKYVLYSSSSLLLINFLAFLPFFIGEGDDLNLLGVLLLEEGDSDTKRMGLRGVPLAEDSI